MEQRKNSIFRNQAVEKISPPDQLSDYLRVTNPGVWVVLAVIILLLIGLFVWSCIGTLETTADVKVIVEDHKAEILLLDGSSVEAGKPLRVAGQEVKIASVETDNTAERCAMRSCFCRTEPMTAWWSSSKYVRFLSCLKATDSRDLLWKSQRKKLL